MLKGTVKWFNPTKGYGFITPAEGGEDVLVHVSMIEHEQIVQLDEGQAVHYEAEAGPKGMRATKVVVA
jgi:CspA family cold shock protein